MAVGETVALNATVPQAVMARDAFIQNVGLGHCELGIETDPRLGVATAFDELSDAIR